MKVRAIPVILFMLLSTMALTAGSRTLCHAGGPREESGVITIGSDAELLSTASALGWKGDGSGGSPVLIDNLTFETGGGYYGLFIGNTTLNLLIDNCSFCNSTDGLLHSFSSSGLILSNAAAITIQNSDFNLNTNGITISNCRNVIVKNSTFLRNLKGVEVLLSDDCTVRNCIFVENTRDAIHLKTSENCIIRDNLGLRNDPAIMLYNSCFNRIENNTLLYTGDEGVLLELSDHNLIHGNHVNGYGDGDGITLSRTSSWNKVWDNIIRDPQEYGILLMTAPSNQFHSNRLFNCSLVIDDDRQDIFSSTYHTSVVADNNTVNGKPLLFIKNTDLGGGTISPNCGQLILVNVTHGGVENVSLDRATFGITLFQCEDIKVCNFTIENMIYHGSVISYSQDVVLERSTFSNCHYSTLVRHSERTAIMNNTMAFCDTGVYIRSSLDCIVGENTVMNAGNHGIVCHDSKFNITKNTFSFCGVGISTPSGGPDEKLNHVRDNLISDCSVGIDEIGWYNKVHHNRIEDCMIGIGSGTSLHVNSTICHNHIEGSNGILIDGEMIHIHNNTVLADGGYGIHISGYQNNVIEYNRMFNCSLTFSDFKQGIRKNTIGSGNEVNSLPVLKMLDPGGVYEFGCGPMQAGQVLISSNYVNISDVHVSNATVGFYIDANTAIVLDCSATGCGVGMEVSDDPMIEGCAFTDNGIGISVGKISSMANIKGCEFRSNSLGLFNDGGHGLQVIENIFLSNDVAVRGHGDGSFNIRSNRFHDGFGYALYLNSDDDVVMGNAFYNNDHGAEGGCQASVSEWALVSGNHWSDHNGTYDLFSGVIDNPHKYDGSPIAYIPKGIVRPPEILDVHKVDENVSIQFYHPVAYEHMVYRMPAGGGDVEELSVLTGDLDTYMDDTASDHIKYDYFVQSFTDLGTTFPSIPYRYLVDRTSPTLDIIYPLNGSYHAADNMTIGWNCTDTGIGNMEVYIYLDDELPFLVSGDNRTTLSDLTEGQHRVKISVMDGYGNTVEGTVYFFIDRLAPSLELIQPLDGWRLVSGDIHLKAVSWDRNGLSRVEYILDGTVTGISAESNISYQIHDVGEGYHELILRSYDPAGNMAEVVVNFFMDMTLPGIVRITPEPPLIDPDEKYMFIEFSENMDPEKMEFELNGDNIDFQYDGAETWLFYTPLSLLERGTQYNLSVRGKDIGGNPMIETFIEFTIRERSYRVDISLKDNLTGEPVTIYLLAVVEDDIGYSCSTENGTVVLFLPAGHHVVTISGYGYQDRIFEFDLSGDVEFELGLEELENNGPTPDKEPFPWFLIITFVATILLILFFYIVPAKLSTKYRDEE